MPPITATTKKIFVAIAKKDLTLLKAALNEPDADVNAYDGDATPLHFAVYEDWAAGIEYLLSRSDIQPNLPSNDDEPCTPLYAAIELYNDHIYNLRVLQTLLKSPDVDVNAKNKKNETALSFELRKHNADMRAIQLILNHPSFFPDPTEITHLIVNATKRRTEIALGILNCLFSHPRIDQALDKFSGLQIQELWDALGSSTFTIYEMIASKILTRAFKKNSNSALEDAKSVFSEFENIEKILDYSQKMAAYPENFIFLFGFYPVFEQVRLKSAGDIIPAFIENESENDRFLRYATTFFENPLGRLVESFYLDELRPVVRLLLKNDKIDINQKIGFFNKPTLCKAIEEEKVSLVQLLLEQEKIDPTLPERTGNTPLHIAMGKNHGEIVTLLLQHPKVVEKIYEKNDEGNTPLHVGLESGSIEACKILIQSGLLKNFTSTNDNEKTLLHYVFSRIRNAKILPLLLDKEGISDILDAKDQDGATPLKLAIHCNNIVMFKLLLARLKLENKALLIEREEIIPDPEVNPKGFAAHAAMEKSPEITAYYAALSLLKNDPNLTCEKVFAKLEAQHFPRHETWTEGCKTTAFKHALRTAQYPDDLFALTVFLCDGLLQLETEDDTLVKEVLSRNQRFFRIMQQLPMELQMDLCNKAYDNPNPSISGKSTEDAFKRLARLVLKVG